MKKLTILIMSILLIGCKNNTPKTEENIGQKEEIAYQKETSNKNQRKIETRSSSLSLPSNIQSKENEPYSLKELENLDYSKEFFFENVYIRIPSRAKVNKNDKTYKIELPKSDKYNLDISFRKIENDEILKEDDLIKSCEMLTATLGSKEQVISKVTSNPMSNIKSAYFVSKQNDFYLVHFLVETPTSKIHFTIKEDRNLSKIADDLMADILTGIYTTNDDPLEVGKDFTDYTDAVDIYAGNKVELDSFSLNIPDNFILNQDENEMKAYVSKKNGTIVSEIIVKVQDKDNKNLNDVFDDNSGSIIYPANIINKGLVETGTVRNFPYLKSGANLYMPAYSLKGDKIIIEGEDKFISIFILGPITNTAQTKIMSTSIINSIK
ncbi:hypothetical protein [Anaerococcus prevotii]|uniref:Putative lipoprotein n=1 Tax=Anaerococcus prevotii ACS-065-V-Col13 TaxID=879305 RepID=F0GW75_9FIRM|nr:hypothetical protein [Anaerococcus prevotii]EGC81938.1 putative lipoprotein [Anaerococcus prevotii ACS-065-V-Col13]